MREVSHIKSEWEESHLIGELNTYKNMIFCGNLYHYTGLATLWNILDSDCLFARNVRFSNDSQEYQLGVRQLCQYLGRTQLRPDDCYMLCFCKEEELLSQWREYGKGGVCLTFDFSSEHYYTLRCNGKTREMNLQDGIGKEEAGYRIPPQLYSEELKYDYQYAMPMSVMYILDGDALTSKKMDEIKQLMETKGETQKDTCWKKIIPYIKNKRFGEEKEVRLIFSIKKENAPFQVEYLTDEEIKKPYIKVEFDFAEMKYEDQCQVISRNIPPDLSAEIRQELDSMNNKLQYPFLAGKDEGVSISIKQNDRKKSGKMEFEIGSCRMQNMVFEYFYEWANKWNCRLQGPEIKVWCRGHLPIREIRVGPLRNKEEVAESIRHYISNIYWLKCVDVKSSDISYREKSISR